MTDDQIADFAETLIGVSVPRIVTHAPVLVVDSPDGYAYSDGIHAMADGTLVAAYLLAAIAGNYPARAKLSSNSGSTWGAPVTLLDNLGCASVDLPSGDLLMLPMGFIGEAEAAAYGSLINGTTKAVTTSSLLTLSLDFTPGANSQIVFTQPIADSGTGWIGAIQYKLPAGTRSGLVCVESADGYAWTQRGAIAGPDCALTGTDGPSEAAIVRLADESLHCVFRLQSALACGQSTSATGETWATATEATSMHSMSARGVTLTNGARVFLTGRDIAVPGGTGMYLHVCRADGSVSHYDLTARHNAHRPDDLLTVSYTNFGMCSTGSGQVAVLYDQSDNGMSEAGWRVWCMLVDIEP
jgi:hypothetical protein